MHRFEGFGYLLDINRAVVIGEAAIQHTSQGDPHEFERLNELGSSLFRRFECLGGLDDLNQSVLRFEAAVALTPDNCCTV
jgi:hypothetical protein